MKLFADTQFACNMKMVKLSYFDKNYFTGKEIG